MCWGQLGIFLTGLIPEVSMYPDSTETSHLTTGVLVRYPSAFSQLLRRFTSTKFLQNASRAALQN
jgi:hypothetical protein